MIHMIISNKFFLWIISYFFCVTILLSINRAALYKERGDTEYIQKQFPIAIDFYKKAIAKNPNYLPALISLGRLLRETDSLKNSKFYLKKAYKIAPKNKEVLVELAKTYFDQKDFVASKKIVNKGIQLYPYNPDLNYLKSKVYLLHNKKYLAEKKLKKNLRSNPNHIPSYILLSDIYTQKGNYTKAINFLKMSHLIEPDNTDILVHIARAKLLRSVRELDSLLYDDPITIKAFSEAIHDLESVKNFDYYHLTSNLLLGKIYSLTKNCNNAMPYLEAVLKNNPSHFEAQYYQGYCNPKTSLKIYPTLLANNSNDEILRYHLQKNLLHFTRRRESPNIMRFVEEHYSKGKQLSTLNQETQAFQEFKWASYLFPGHLKTNKELIRYYRTKSDFRYLTKTLQFLKDRTRGTKYQDMYEQLVQERRNKIFYRARIPFPEKVRTPTPLFVFYFKPENPFGTYPDAGRAIAHKLSFALSEMGRVRILPEDELNEIYKKITKKKFFGLGGYHNASLAKEVKYCFDHYLKMLKVNQNIRNKASFGKQSLRYIIRGSYQKIAQGIRVTMEIVDLNTGLNIYRTKAQAEGLSYLNHLAVQLSNKIYDHIPYYGRVLAIKNEKVLINLGKRDGLQKKTRLLATKNGAVIVELEVVDVDTDLSWVKATNDSYNIFRLQPGDLVEPKS